MGFGFFFPFCLVRLGCCSTCFFYEFIVIWVRGIGWKFGLGGMKYPCICLLLWFPKGNPSLLQVKILAERMARCCAACARIHTSDETMD